MGIVLSLAVFVSSTCSVGGKQLRHIPQLPVRTQSFVEQYGKPVWWLAVVRERFNATDRCIAASIHPSAVTTAYSSARSESLALDLEIPNMSP